MSYSDKVCAGCPHLKVNRGDGVMSMALPYCGRATPDTGPIAPHSSINKGKHWEVTYTRVPEFCQNPDKSPSTKSAPYKEWAVLTYDSVPYTI